MLQVWNLIQIREITHTIVGVTEGDFTTNVSVTGNDEVTFTIRYANDVASNTKIAKKIIFTTVK